LTAELVARFRAARRDPSRVVLEGLHALKHALRFGAAIELAVSADPAHVAALAAELAPDVADDLAARLQSVDAATYAATMPRPHETAVVAIAARPDVDLEAVRARQDRPLVLLHAPRHPGNVGAVVRVAAALDAAGVVVLGDLDPWLPAAIRGGAGLQFALPCLRSPALPVLARPMIAFTPGGDPLGARALPTNAALLFGGERHGLPETLVKTADATAEIPMRAGVSSLNLATAVTVALSRMTCP